MNPVTDPSILAQLNGAGAAGPVTDPNILAQLNGDSESSGFLGNVGNDWSQRWNENVPKAVGSYLSGQQGLPETNLQVAGQAAGALGDVVSEGVKSAIPDSYVDAAHSTANAINDTSFGQKMGDMLMAGKEGISSIAAANPRLTRNAEALGNILSVGAGGKGVASVEGAGAKLGLGDALYNSGKASQEAAREKFIQDLTLPKQTPTVKADMASRTKQVDGTNAYQPTNYEKQVASTVGGIPEVHPGNSNVRNLNLIQEANSREAEALKERLKANDAPISDDVIQNTLVDTLNGLSNNPYISGADASKAAGNVVNKALEIISSKPQTASSMLDARKELDAWVKSQKGDKAFNPALDSPITTAVQQVRQAMNKMVADAVPSAEVTASLQKQSQLYQAADNLAPKAAGEAATRLGRTLQKVTPRSLTGMVGLGAGAGAGVEALAHIPPSALLAGGAGYGLYRGATSPVTRIGLGKALGVSKPAATVEAAATSKPLLALPAPKMVGDRYGVTAFESQAQKLPDERGVADFRSPRTPDPKAAIAATEKTAPFFDAAEAEKQGQIAQMFNESNKQKLGEYIANSLKKSQDANLSVSELGKKLAALLSGE